MQKCIDQQVGARLERLDYFIKKLTPEKQALYNEHLQQCSFCKNRAASAAAQRRIKGLLNMLGGFVLLVFGAVFPLPIPGIGYVFVIAGIGWFFIGIYRLISGRD